MHAISLEKQRCMYCVSEIKGDLKGPSFCYNLFMGGNWVRALKKERLLRARNKKKRGTEKGKKSRFSRKRKKKGKNCPAWPFKRGRYGLQPEKEEEEREGKKLVRNLVRHFLQSSSTLLFTPKFLLFGHLEGFPHLTSLSHKHTRDKEEKDVKIK